MLLTFFGLIIFFIFIAIRTSAPALTLMYGDLSVSDSTEMAAKLDIANIAYKISDDGKQISVPPKQVGKARMLLAQDGLPHQGSVGYEIFDQRQSFGVTTFQQNINALRALEGELSRTLGTIESVRSARVHLVLPQHELFSREETPASASVFLTLNKNGSIAQEQISAMQHLVAASVPQLKPSNVAIIDQAGNLLARGEADEAGDGASARGGDEMRQKYEMRLARRIEGMIGRIVGYGKVRASVSADIDFDVVSRNSESFNPDGQVARSTQSTTEENADTTAAAGAGVTVQNNLPGIPAAGSNGGSGGSKSSRTEETTNYEITKTIENLVRASGEVKKQSIAVLIDGAYETDTEAKKPDEGKEEDWQPPKKYIPRTQEEMDKIATLVKSAAGYDEGRGDAVQVVNMRFAESEGGSPAAVDGSLLMGFPKAEILNMAETLSLSIVAVLVILLVLRPLATHITAGSRGRGGDGSSQEDMALLAAGGGQAQLAPPMAGMIGGGNEELDSMMDMSAVEGKVKASSLQKISDLVTSHPNETVSVLRQWMSQET